MYAFLQPIHSFLPYLILPLLIICVLVFFIKLIAKKNFSKMDKVLAVISLSLVHLQFVLGLVLYFVSPIAKMARQSGEMMENPNDRLYALEHPLTMIVAVILISVGYSKAKKAELPKVKFRWLAIFYLIGLVLILSRIPYNAWVS